MCRLRQPEARALYSIQRDAGAHKFQPTMTRAHLVRQGLAICDKAGYWAITEEGALALQCVDVQPMLADLKRRDMKLSVYYWPNALKRYSTGQVMVLASSAEDAWARIKKADPQAWICLQSSGGYVSLRDDETDAELDEALAEALHEKFTEYGKSIPAPPAPMVMALDKAPPFIAWGSE